MNNRPIAHDEAGTYLRDILDPTAPLYNIVTDKDIIIQPNIVEELHVSLHACVRVFVFVVCVRVFVFVRVRLFIVCVRAFVCSCSLLVILFSCSFVFS